jgi:hypothetical protein
MRHELTPRTAVATSSIGRHGRWSVAAAVLAAAVTFATPTAWGATGPSPDARDAALATKVASDRRSPDARDAAIAAEQKSLARTDLRSPDARDAANRSRFPSAPSIQVVSRDGRISFQWGDAGIGAGAAIVLVLLAGGALVAIHRRQQARIRSLGSALPTS